MEAARIDGAGPGNIFLNVIVPAIAPVARAVTAADAPAVGAAILPFNHSLLPTRFALLKGRNNFLCLDRMAESEARGETREKSSPIQAHATPPVKDLARF